jgi:hypothetical protein
VRLAVIDHRFPWEVVVEPVVELHEADLKCTVKCGVETTEDQSCVSRCCVVPGRGTSMENSHGRYVAKFDDFPVSREKLTMYSSVGSSQRSVS